LASISLSKTKVRIKNHLLSNEGNGLGRAMMKKIAEVISLITLTETDSQTTANDVSFPMVFKC
jgi:hypothetical protein